MSTGDVADGQSSVRISVSNGVHIAVVRVFVHTWNGLSHVKRTQVTNNPVLRSVTVMVLNSIICLKSAQPYDLSETSILIPIF